MQFLRTLTNEFINTEKIESVTIKEAGLPDKRYEIIVSLNEGNEYITKIFTELNSKDPDKEAREFLVRLVCSMGKVLNID